jgi:hypothetical protein
VSGVDFFLVSLGREEEHVSHIGIHRVLLAQIERALIGTTSSVVIIDIDRLWD